MLGTILHQFDGHEIVDDLISIDFDVSETSKYCMWGPLAPVRFAIISIGGDYIDFPNFFMSIPIPF